MSGAGEPRRVSVVVPTLNAGPHLPALLEALRAQRPRPPDELLLVDSGSTDGTRESAAAQGQAPPVTVLPLACFTHGGARNLGARHARGELVVFLSQDARPQDDGWLAALLAPLADPAVAAACSRQVPREDANPMERFFLQTHFPDGSEAVVSRPRPGAELRFQREVFFSNVSAAARRDVLLAHPFDETLIMSEDQQFARDLLAAGLGVAYAPASRVVHSHNYTLRQAFRRYFDSVYSLRRIFPRHGVGDSVSLGAGYVRRELAHIARHHPRWLPYYAGYTASKALATLAAHAADALPRRLARRLSLHAAWWDTPAARARPGAPRA